ncbi:MAG: hypothetical protein EBS29_14085, partial [Chloroflexia bacterium]|nr:hypothetical protein [Chloroflexia bacterium]
MSGLQGLCSLHFAPFISHASEKKRRGKQRVHLLSPTKTSRTSFIWSWAVGETEGEEERRGEEKRML